MHAYLTMPLHMHDIHTHKLYIHYVGTTMHTLHTPGENVATHYVHRAQMIMKMNYIGYISYI